MTKHLSAISLLALAAPLCTYASKPLEDILPANTSIIAGVRNYDALGKACKEGPVSEIVNNQQIRDVLRPLIDNFQQKINESKNDETLSWKEVKEHLGGQIVIGANFDKPLEAELENINSNVLPDIILLAEVRDGDALTHLIVEALEEDSHEKDSGVTICETESFMSEDIHHFSSCDKTPAKTDTEEKNAGAEGATENAKSPAKSNSPDNFYFGNVDETFFATLSIEEARAAIEAIKGDEKGTLAEEARISQIHSISENNDVYVCVYAKPFSDLIETAIRKEFKTEGEGNPDPTKPNPEAIINALGLSSIHSCTFSLKFEQDCVRCGMQFAYDSSYGIGKLFCSIGDSYPTPDFVKDSTTKVVSSLGFNTSTFISELKTIIFTAYPASAMIYHAQIAQIQQQCGANLDTDILGGFDEGFVMMQVNNPDTTQTGFLEVVPVYALKLKDPATFQRSLSSLLAVLPNAAAIKSTDFGGTRIISIPVGANSFSISTKDGWLVMGLSEAAIQSTLSTSEADKSFWQGSRYNEILSGKLASGGTGMSYFDSDVYTRSILYIVAMVYNNSIAKNPDDSSKQIDVNLIPNIKDIPLTLCGKSYKTPEGMISESYLLKK
jgi:hypothetical protein